MHTEVAVLISNSISYSHFVINWDQLKRNLPVAEWKLNSPAKSSVRSILSPSCATLDNAVAYSRSDFDFCKRHLRIVSISLISPSCRAISASWTLLPCDENPIFTLFDEFFSLKNWFFLNTDTIFIHFLLLLSFFVSSSKLFNFSATILSFFRCLLPRCVF